MKLRPRLKPRWYHRITVEPAPAPTRIRFGDREIAATVRALLLTETRHRPVLYVPREDVADDVLEVSPHTGYCPFKGEATYFTLRAGGRVAEGAAWTYRAPYDPVAQIVGHVGFDPRHVEIERATPPA